MKNNIIYIIFFICGITFAQNTIEMVVDTTNIRIGEQIEYKISVDKANTSTTLSNQVIFPKLVLDSLKKIEVVKDLKVDTTQTKYIKKYLLTGFDSGRYEIPRQEVYINKKKFLTNSLLIDVATIKVDTLKQKLFPIKNISKVKESKIEDWFSKLWNAIMGSLLYQLLLIMFFVLIGFVFWLIYKSNKQNKQRLLSLPPYIEAIQRLEKLDEKQLWQQDKVKLYYIELTDIIRTYIERELNIPALESTTDELMETIRDFNKIKTLDLPKETVINLQKLLQEADLVKFAKYKPLANEIEHHRVETESIINELKPKPNQEDEVVE